MSRISDILIEISERLESDMSDEQIAEQVGCPVKWVTDERKEWEDYAEAGRDYAPF